MMWNDTYLVDLISLQKGYDASRDKMMLPHLSNFLFINVDYIKRRKTTMAFDPSIGGHSKKWMKE